MEILLWEINIHFYQNEKMLILPELSISPINELTSFDNQSGHYQSSIADRDIFLNAISRTY